MRIEEFETEIKETLGEGFEVNYESQKDAKFLQIIADGILAFGEGKSWEECFKNGLKNLKIKIIIDQEE